MLTAACIDAARASGVTTLVLLTETAEELFQQFEFRAVSRDEVPAAVQQSQEFVSACPASASAMVLDLVACRW
jgi:amino-acid N-acetyltransferase